jgi:ribosome recycling factor
MDFKDLKKRIEDIKEWLKNEYMGIQTGRATPTILDSVKVDSYGAKVPINQIGSITSEGPRTLRVSVWDRSQIEAVEKAINNANLGVSASSDDQGIRVFFPELTAEKRAALSKIMGQKHEESRVSLRQARDDVWSEIQKKERDGEITEDEKFRFKEEMENIISEANKELDEMTLRKEKDISV